MSTARVTIAKKDEVYLWVSGEPHVLREMTDYFSFKVPDAKFMPAYKMGHWDGYVRLLDYKDHTIYVGLIDYIRLFCKERGYVLKYEGDVDENFSLNEANDFIESLGLPFKPREYQIETFVAAVRKRRMLLLSPTGSGKSLIIYLMIRWYMEKHDRKHLIIVPSTSLVAQMKKDFKSYGLQGSPVHQIMSGRDKQTDKPIVISTWQSLFKMPKKYFEQFGTVVVDECHGVKAKSLTNIMTKMTNTPYRFGTTGTLDGTLTNKLVIEGLLGKVRKVTATANLIEEKVLADFMVKSIILKHQQKVPTDLKYQEEIDHLVSHEARNRFIKNLILSLKGNTLVLFNYVEKHGVPLFNMINDARSADRPCFFVYGGTELDVREQVRARVEEEDNAIIIASSGVYSQGINIKRLHNVVFTHPGKSRVRTLQSIGRALRRVDDEEAVLYDIVDDLSSGRKTRNFSLKHYQERFAIYKSEKFKVKTYNVELKG